LEAAGADQFVALDVHDLVALDNAFRIPVDHLSALPMMVDCFAQQFDEEGLTVASPDIGGIKRKQQLPRNTRRATGSLGEHGLRREAARERWCAFRRHPRRQRDC
jgi:ribose-phosphate pyrophosphokinase